MQPRPPLQLPDRDPRDEVQPAQLSPFLHPNHVPFLPALDRPTKHQLRPRPDAPSGYLTRVTFQPERAALSPRRRLGHLRDAEPPLRVHDLRHTFGTLAVRTAPVRTVQAWMGHASVTTTERYTHHVPAADDAQRLARAFGTAA